MKRVEISELSLKPFSVLDRDWALLVAGSVHPNPMTVSWGNLGTLWNRPVITVFVRPVRFTFELLEAEPEFTLNFLPEAGRSALDLCGSRSGRDTDKWAAAGISPEPSEKVAVPRVAGARRTFECRVLSTADLDPSRFLDPAIESLYPGKDYHRAYIGEVLAALEG